jgi:hypothetical protein
MIKELQQLKATGTNTKNSRFGSALCSPGDINKDGAMGKYCNLFMCGIVTKFFDHTLQRDQINI